jgi:hypothetical protein
MSCIACDIEVLELESGSLYGSIKNLQKICNVCGGHISKQNFSYAKGSILKSEKQEFHFFLFLPQYLPHITGKIEK